MKVVLFNLLLVALCYLEEASGHGMMLEPSNRASLWRFDWKQPSNYNDMGYFCGGVKFGLVTIATMVSKFVTVVLALVCLQKVSGHGMLMDPTNRASRWRVDPKAPINYDDNAFFCGGFAVQYEQNGGKCGVCGDNYADPVPRSNENTGKFGNGVISKTYTAGSIITANVTLTANHLGSFSYSLCVLKDPTKPETEDCFVDLPLADGSSKYPVSADEYEIVNQVQLPAGVTCDRCVLRWHYKSGNSWGICTDGTQRMGCGAQETFRSCADIAIVA
ncbi:hypothetical protein TcasGA2_TC016350 [Tribolium castaneum]|uniref:Chitin-binding type-4 domain-containing protein n=2 Tax=Tribolium castaneum TaxID=7070 RepID=D6WPC5_TRICA|nr:hypothetical protein TcasGA2_TC016350 [Tribolium castaneum]